jgi:type II secretory pathway pseudopilin PulG
MRHTRSTGFTLIEVMISGVLLAMLMLAVMGLLSQAQNDMAKQAVQTEVTEKTRRTMWKLAQELSESSFDHVIAGYRSKTNSGNGTVRNYVTSANEANMVQCTDTSCPWMTPASGGAYYEPQVLLGRRVQMEFGHSSASSTPHILDTSDLGASGHNISHDTTGRIWVGRSAGPCAAGHTITANATASVDFGMIMFATPRNRSGVFVSQEGSDFGTDWQGLVIYAPYSVGGNVTELRRYEFFIDDLIDSSDGVTAWSTGTGQGWLAPPTDETHNHSGAGISGTEFATNVPVDKPTLGDLLDFDKDGAIADGCVEILAGDTPDATDETFDIVQVSGESLITYIKQGNFGGGTFDFSLTINRRTGEINCAVDHVFASGDTYRRSVRITGRQPKTIASRVTDIEFATIRNCPWKDDSTSSSNDENETGLLPGQDSTVIRITAMFDKLLGQSQDATSSGSNIERQLTSQEIVVTRVQPRN